MEIPAIGILLLFFWLIGLTVWVLVMKRGPEWPKGEQGYSGSYSRDDISIYELRDPAIALLDDATYMKKLIKNINAYQLHGGQVLASSIEKTGGE